ncbi:MAG: hypothetical protein LC808_44045, partial [Actinobacteria bacterium]|nr:hypothetical protein [Actinomycetota bacterium]
TGPTLHAPVELMPLEQGMKLQWDYRTRKVKDATIDERDAYQKLETRYHDLGSGDKPTHVTGPLTKTGTGWILYVRKFEQ